VDLDAVRTFVAAADAGQFSEAAADLSITQHAVSKRIAAPGIVAGTEWAAYYGELAATFGLTIDATGPNFGTEPLLEMIAGSPAGNPRRRADPPRLARRVRPAARYRARPDAGLPALTDLVPRQTRTPHSAHSATISVPPGPAIVAPAPGHRHGRSTQYPPRPRREPMLSWSRAW
jgi:Bacterial regulatory helix-turn-helix protein, lysR family